MNMDDQDHVDAAYLLRRLSLRMTALHERDAWCFPSATECCRSMHRNNQPLEAEMADSRAIITATATANGATVASSPPSAPFVERSNPMGSGNAQTVSSKDPKAVAQAATDMKNVVRRKLTGYVGFANLPNQWHRKSVRKGFNFNVMVVGTLSPHL